MICLDDGKSGVVTEGYFFSRISAWRNVRRDGMMKVHCSCINDSYSCGVIP